MSQDRRKSLDFLEAGELVPMHQGNGSYSFVSPKRTRKLPAVIVAEPPNLDFEDDVPTRDITPLAARGTPPFGTYLAVVERYRSDDDGPADEEDPVVVGDLDLLASQPTVELAVVEAPATMPAATRRHDPDLCSCDKMLSALASKVIMVVCDGPVTLSPAVLREEVLLKGEFNLDSIERAYDGKPWAFRHCPFEGRLIDDQVEILTQVDNMTCCGMMHEAVLHGRVELPAPDRYDKEWSKFVDPGRTATIFSYCPWCATDTIDLALARYKRHNGH